MAQPSPPPTRFTTGLSTDFPWGPLAHFGLPNPFAYMMWRDDFFEKSAQYTTTATGNGTAAIAAGAGGTLLFTTNSSTPAGSDIVSVQLPAAPFAFVAGKKAFFLTRLKLSSATNAAFRVGMVPTDTTPLTVTDGIFFDKATGSLTNLNLIHTASSTATSVAVPTSAYTLANDTYMDLAWYLDPTGTIYAFTGAQLVGWLPQSGTGTTVGSRGPSASIKPATLASAALNLVLVIGSGTAASSTMTVDFVLAAVER